MFAVLLFVSPAFTAPNLAFSQSSPLGAAQPNDATRKLSAAPSPGPSKGIKSVKTEEPRIIMDQKTHTVRILIGGKEIMTVDAGGLHVHGNIDYTGVSTAGGPVHGK
jgi:hypothetical protein